MENYVFKITQKRESKVSKTRPFMGGNRETRNYKNLWGEEERLQRYGQLIVVMKQNHNTVYNCKYAAFG